MKARPVALGVALVVLVVLPFLLSDLRTMQLATAGAYFVAILGLDVLAGHSGRISLGHGALMAVGAYTTAILVAHHGVQDVWTIPLAALVASAVGLVVAVPALLGGGVYLALATFGLAVVLPSIVERFDHFTGGPTGTSFFGSGHETGHGAGVMLLGGHVTHEQFAYALAWSVGAVLFVLARWLLDGRFGRSLRAVRDSELAAVAAGVDQGAHRLAAFAVSAAYAGVAGALLAITNAYASPSVFSAQLSLYLVVGAFVGGLGSIWGAAIGAVVVQFLPDAVGVVPGVDTSRAGPATFAYGALLVAVMLLLPLAGRVRRR